MKTFAKTACFVLLVTCAGSAMSLAQTAPPAATTAKPPAAAVKTLSRRFAGKILSVDAKAKTVALQGPAKVVLVLTDKSVITKVKTPATFDALAADQPVTGIERQDASGKWQVESLHVGDPRQLLTEPAPKVVIAPEKKK